MLADIMELNHCENIIEVLSLTEKLNLRLNLFEAQNTYFNLIYNRLPDLIESLRNSSNIPAEKRFVATLLNLGEKLHFNVDKYYINLNKLTSRIENNYLA